MHVHVEKGDGLAKFWLNPIRLARSTGFPQHELTEIRKLAEKHEKIFIKRWHEFFKKS